MHRTRDEHVGASLPSTPAAAHGAAVGGMPARSADMLVETFCVYQIIQNGIENEECMCERVMTYGDEVVHTSRVYVRSIYRHAC